MNDESYHLLKVSDLLSRYYRAKEVGDAEVSWRAWRDFDQYCTSVGVDAKALYEKWRGLR